MNETRTAGCPSFENLKFPWKDNVRLSSSSEVFLKTVVLKYKHLSDIIFDGKTAPLECQNHFAKDVKRYRNALLLELYQPLRTPFSQNTYH